MKKPKMRPLNNNHSEDIKSKKTSRNSHSSASVKSKLARRDSIEGIHRKNSNVKSVSSSGDPRDLTCNSNENSALSSPRVGAKKSNGIQKKSCFAQQRNVKDESSDFNESDTSGEPTILDEDEQMIGPLSA